MSGGSFNYKFKEVKDIYEGKLEDGEMNDLLLDFVKVLKALEWWKSEGCSEQRYRDEIYNFKFKWFDTPREERLKRYIDEGLNDIATQLYKMIGVIK